MKGPHANIFFSSHLNILNIYVKIGDWVIWIAIFVTKLIIMNIICFLVSGVRTLGASIVTNK
jgi:hypothetical protein